MLSDPTMDERRVLCAAVRVQLASFEGMANWRKENGEPIDPDKARDIDTLRSLLGQLLHPNQ